MTTDFHYSLTFNDPSKHFVDNQKSLLYYSQAKGSLKNLSKMHDTFLTTAPAYIPALQKYFFCFDDFLLLGHLIYQKKLSNLHQVHQSILLGNPMVTSKIY